MENIMDGNALTFLCFHKNDFIEWEYSNPYFDLSFVLQNIMIQTYINKNTYLTKFQLYGYSDSSYELLYSYDESTNTLKNNYLSLSSTTAYRKFKIVFLDEIIFISNIKWFGNYVYQEKTSFSSTFPYSMKISKTETNEDRISKERRNQKQNPGRK